MAARLFNLSRPPIASLHNDYYAHGRQSFSKMPDAHNKHYVINKTRCAGRCGAASSRFVAWVLLESPLRAGGGYGGKSPFSRSNRASCRGGAIWCAAILSTAARDWQPIRAGRKIKIPPNIRNAAGALISRSWPVSACDLFIGSGGGG